ncbi:MAG: endonuclease III [Anaerococcus sp.]|nr:endonuclease III [Anaerococcus sp.]
MLEILDQTYPDVDYSMLNFTTPFELLVATILSAQSTDVRVNKVTEVMFKDLNTPSDFANADIKTIENYIKTVGIYKNKAKNIKATSKILLEDYKGQLPQSRSELMKLPGVGRKTANVVISNAFNIPSIAVDTHVFRLANRIGLAKANNVLNTEKDLERNIPKDKWRKTHHQLISHGRAICKARNPLCDQCPLNQVCEYKRKDHD